MSYTKKKPFTPQEDILLADAVENYGQDWQTVAKLVPGHNAKQCRERWQFALSPSQTIEWDDEMDERLLKLAGQYGNNYEAKSVRAWFILALLVRVEPLPNCHGRGMQHRMR